MIHWRLTSAQYEAAVFAMERDRLPYPTWNAVRAGDDAELARLRREAIDSLRPRVDDDLARLLRTLVEPQVRLHVHGRLGPDPENPEVQVRAYAGFGPDMAAVAVQDSDPEPGVSGDVSLSLCTHVQALGLLARMLPEQPPGRHELAALKSELDLEPEWSGGWNRPPTLRERLDAFFARPRSGWGEVLCYPGRFLDNRTDGVQGFLWMDFPRDGRYYIREDAAGYTVQPMTADGFVGHARALARRVRDLGPHAARN
ncbi:ESX secretion-associated protein EspG [Nocardia veterana]|uniref:ESX secretion-associated protein EspG n=1 Tax=Nocardia veterana TaxID=132249 RepID=A0A7X6RL93_9NOCA|nr:ESX secretion-associated protein EspG [Nocardia veterana]NKY89479.1 ESX secretion-associated protein EspG [Nocardia veterana]